MNVFFIVTGCIGKVQGVPALLGGLLRRRIRRLVAFSAKPALTVRLSLTVSQVSRPCRYPAENMRCRPPAESWDSKNQNPPNFRGVYVGKSSAKAWNWGIIDLI